jgi:hypothetical protein
VGGNLEDSHAGASRDMDAAGDSGVALEPRYDRDDRWMQVQ